MAFGDVIFLDKTFKVTTGNPQALITGVYGQEQNRPPHFTVQSSDVPYIEEPVHAFIKDSFKQGIFPLWNPHQACGYSLLGMMHLGLLWPLNLVLRFLPDTIGWDFIVLSRLFLAGLFTFWFLRALNFNRLTALTSAIIYMLSGPMLLIQFRYANVEILTPLVLLTMERLLKKPGLKSGVAVALAVGLTILAGDAEHIFLVNAYACLYFIFRLATLKPRPPVFKTGGYLAGAFILACGLTAIVLLPFFRDWFTEVWNNHPPNVGAYARGHTIGKETLLCMIMPHFFQYPPLTLNFIRASWIGYLGILPVVLGFTSLLSRQRQKLSYFFIFMALFLFAKGYIDSPLFNWVGYLPIVSMVRFDFHTPHLIAFSVAVAAGMGLRLLALRRHALPVGALFILIFYAVIFFSLWDYHKAANFKPAFSAVIQAAVWLTILLGLLAAKNFGRLRIRTFLTLALAVVFLELYIYIPRPHVKRFDSFPRVPYIEFLKSVPERCRNYGIFWALYPNTASGYGVDDFGFVDGVVPGRYVQFINQFVIKGYFKKDTTRSSFWVAPVTFLNSAQPYLDMLNIKYTAAPKPKDLQRFFPLARSKNFPQPIPFQEADIYVSPSALPRAYIVHKAIFEPVESAVFETMRKIKSLFRDVAVIQHAVIPQIREQLLKAPLRDNSSSKIVKYTPNEVIIAADMLSPGFLVLADTYHPDWKAWVDGQPTDIYITNYLVRSVFLPAGQHTVRFSFKPWSFYLGACISLFSLILPAFIFLKKAKTK